MLLVKGLDGRSRPGRFHSHLTSIKPPDFASAGVVLGWGLRAALHYFLSFQVATEAAVRPPIRPSVGALCRCTIDFPAEAIFTLMRHEIVCHIIPMSRTACFCVVGVKRCTRVLCWGTGGKGSDASWQGDGRKEGRKDACFGQWAAATTFIKMT